MSTMLRSPPKSAVIALASVLALAGCASPYVNPNDIKHEKSVAPKTLDEARVMLQAYHAAYRSKIVTAGQEELMLSNGLITLGGLIVGLAAAKAHSSALAGTAIAGGLGYALGSNNVDKRRAIVYLIGMKALECADDAVVPLAFSPRTTSELRELSTSLESAIHGIHKDSAKVVAAMMAVSQQVPNSEASLETARKALVAAQEAVEQGTKTQTATSTLLKRHEDAGVQLANAVRGIDTDVLEGIRGTNASLEAVPGIIAKLAGDVTVFSNLAKTPTSPVAQTTTDSPHSRTLRNSESSQRSKSDQKRLSFEEDLLDKLFGAVGRLSRSSSTVDAKAEALAGMVKGIEATFNADRLKTCKVENLPVVMVTTPTVLTFTEKAEDTQMITLKGGKPSYSAQFIQSNHTGISVDAASPFLRTDVVAVHATKDVVAGEYQILIRDSADQMQTVKVKVAAAIGAAGVALVTAVATPDDWKQLLARINPVVLANGAKVTVKFAELRGDGGLGLTYVPDAGSNATAEEVKAALSANNAFVAKIAGKDFVVAKELNDE